MPYAPGIQDRSGEIRAQGMAALGQGIGRGVTNFLDTYKQAQKEEEERRKMWGSVSQMAQSDPEFQKRLEDDEKLSGLFTKASTGKANGRDLAELAGAAAAHRFDQEWKMKKAAQEANTQFIQAQREQAIAAKAATEAATKARQIDINQNNELLKTVKRYRDLEQMASKDELGAGTPEQREWEELNKNSMIKPVLDAHALGVDPLNAIKAFDREAKAIAEERDRLNKANADFLAKKAALESKAQYGTPGELELGGKKIITIHSGDQIRGQLDAKTQAPVYIQQRRTIAGPLGPETVETLVPNPVVLKAHGINPADVGIEGVPAPEAPVTGRGAGISGVLGGGTTGTSGTPPVAPKGYLWKDTTGKVIAESDGTKWVKK